MIIASMSTIPERRESFKLLVHRILNEQTQPIDKLYVCLHRYEQPDPTLPQDERLNYYLGNPSEGPWVRYSIARQLADDDILLTLDDDTVYPTNYVEKGVADLIRKEPGAAICYGGLRWNPLTDQFNYYGPERTIIALATTLKEDFQVALLQGICSFLRAGDVKNAIDLKLPGFNTNDDFMISWHLQVTGKKIHCCAREGNWIKDTPHSSAVHALAVRDNPVRRETFLRMIDELGFDPGAGWMEEIKKIPKHIIVLSSHLPQDDPALRDKITALLEKNTLVHVLTPVRNSRLAILQSNTDLPYLQHLTPVLDAGGRFEHVLPVKKWREWKIGRTAELSFQKRLKAIQNKLPDASILDYRNGDL